MQRICFSRWLFWSAVFILAGCEKDEPLPGGALERARIEQVAAYFKEADRESNLVVSVDFHSELGYYELVFENGRRLRVAKTLIERLEENPEDWRVQIAFRDGTEITGGLLGSNLHLEKAVVQLNPFGTAPLTALITLQTKVPGKMSIRVVGQDGADSDVRHSFQYLGRDHHLEILGLYPGVLNTVEVIFTDPAGRERLREAVRLQTAPLPPGIPRFRTVQPHPDPNRNQVYFLNYHPANIPFLVDKFGRVRWYSTGFSQVQKRGFQRLRNGNLCFGADDGSGKIIEYTLLGEKRREWVIDPAYEDIHHDLIELPNGNFVVTVDKTGAPTIEDYLLEIDRATGALLTVWDLNEVLPKRGALFDNPRDWLHVNAVLYDARDHSLIVSAQRQGVFKVSWDNRLRWILAPPEGWGEFGRFRLQPAPGAAPDWCWGQHAPELLPNGNLLLFDNGFGREYGRAPLYSRAVEYAIAEAAIGGTVATVWSYGESRWRDLFSPIVSDVDYLSDSGARLITAGALTYDLTYTDSTAFTLSPSGRPEKARLIEVDGAGNVRWELLVESEDPGGVVYRAERMWLY